MTHTTPVYAALVFPDAGGLDVPAYLETAADILFDRDGAATVDSDGRRVMGKRFQVTVDAQEHGDYGPTIRISMRDLAGRAERSEAAARMLIAVVVASLRHCDCDVIEWCASGALIDRDEFLETCGIDPRTVPPVPALRHPSELHDLRDQLTAVPADCPLIVPIISTAVPCSPADSRMGAAGWLLTSALAFISAPAAVGLAIFGLFRGMEFRLATQVMSVTGLFVALGDTGTLHSVAISLLN